ncbi:MAG: carboxymuconolactone decarboxylase family protein [Pseudomonadales bacterium]|nr:carboxymuconolactone decarboxylase family protein [Pseudomonadales bacterium]
MQSRVNVQQTEPHAFKAMIGIENYLASTGQDTGLVELIKIRASQLNGCAYCIQMHVDIARKQGETEHRIHATSAWKESPLFSEKERTLLALTDEITNISNNAVSGKTYQDCQSYFNENEIAQYIMQIVQINSWNRIALATKLEHD